MKVVDGTSCTREGFPLYLSWDDIEHDCPNELNVREVFSRHGNAVDNATSTIMAAGNDSSWRIRRNIEDLLHSLDERTSNVYTSIVLGGRADAIAWEFGDE